MLSAQFGSGPTKSTRDEAREFLLEFLANGPMATSLVKKAAHESGISEPTLRKAQKELGIRPKKSPGAGGTWYWSLPSAPPTMEGDQGDLFPE